MSSADHRQSQHRQSQTPCTTKPRSQATRVEPAARCSQWLPYNTGVTVASRTKRARNTQRLWSRPPADVLVITRSTGRGFGTTCQAGWRPCRPRERRGSITALMIAFAVSPTSESGVPSCVARAMSSATPPISIMAASGVTGWTPARRIAGPPVIFTTKFANRSPPCPRVGAPRHGPQASGAPSRPSR